MFNNCACRQAAINKIFSKESIEEIMSALVSVHTSFHLPWIPSVLGVDSCFVIPRLVPVDRLSWNIKPVWNICFEISPSTGYKHSCGVRTDLNNIDLFAFTGGRAQGNSGTVGEGYSENFEEIISNRIKGDIQIGMSLKTRSRTLQDESQYFNFFPFSQNHAENRYHWAGLPASYNLMVVHCMISNLLWLRFYFFRFERPVSCPDLPASSESTDSQSMHSEALWQMISMRYLTSRMWLLCA